MSDTKERNPVWAVILILVGILLLLNNLNLLPWTIWSQIWQFWPVILILLGLQHMLGHTRLGESAMLIISILLAAGILYLLLYPHSSFNLLMMPRHLYRPNGFFYRL
jgi:hypothetical protein